MTQRWMRVGAVSGLVLLGSIVFADVVWAANQVRISDGLLQGVTNADGSVLMFKDIPFAAPPLGELRWSAPQTPKKWSGIRLADKFGAPCLQTNVFGDIYFREAQPSEDCLNLDIWVPAKRRKNKLAVFLWFYGGGFVAGSASEPRYDGENLARKDIIVVNANYRLGVFGFFSCPELTAESGHNASGNYGFLDQVAALRWVIQNIASFGGDPHNITIGGESAGSFSVSALMASPLSKGLFQKAIGESGAFFSSPTGKATLPLTPLTVSEQHGKKFAEALGADSLADLRAMPAEKLLQAGAKPGQGFGPNLDGYFLPTDVLSVYEHGDQSHVPLLAGWNADEGQMFVLFSPQKPTAQSFSEMARQRFGSHAAEFLKLYPATTDQEAITSAEALAGDDFTQFATWKWLDMQRMMGDAPVYQYHFEEVPPTKPGATVGSLPASELGSRHAGEIEYVFDTLKLRPDLRWTADDFTLADAMSSYWANFVKTGDPNGKGLPSWPQSNRKDGFQVMHLKGGDIHAGEAGVLLRGRYVFLDETQPATASSTAGGSQ
ncbi:MAG: carboxylesterase family protein [Candidatus Acidiferrales bacterium]